MAPAPHPKSRFFEHLLTNNQPYMAGFKKWVFLPGMLFNSTEQWWGEKKPRSSPHEGVDLCRFENAAGEIKELGGHIKIPAAFAGEIRKIDSDYLGKSMFIGHAIFDGTNRQLYTIYGHTKPGPAVCPQNRVAEGEIIGTIAGLPGRKAATPPHLHITVAWVPASLPPEDLTWQRLGHDARITLLDPLLIL